VNALGYIGMLYAKNPEQLQEIRDKNPIEILSSLAIQVGTASNRK
jgi:ATP adenylyltransferase/5',5'''-P-1,P-4-tetraphosphate phosphorylase II